MPGPYGYTPPADAAPQSGGLSAAQIQQMIQDALAAAEVPLAFDGGDADTDTDNDEAIDFGGA